MRDDILMEAITKKRPLIQTPSDTSPLVYIYPDVLEEMVFNGQWKQELISVGVLVGNRYQCPETEEVYVEIEGFVAGQHLDGWSEIGHHFRKEWKNALAAQRFHSSEASVIGWYIGASKSQEGHPQVLGEVHTEFFRHTWQVGVWFRGEPQPVAFVSQDNNIQPVEIAVIKPSTFSSVG